MYLYLYIYLYTKQCLNTYIFLLCYLKMVTSTSKLRRLLKCIHHSSWMLVKQRLLNLCMKTYSESDMIKNLSRKKEVPKIHSTTSCKTAQTNLETHLTEKTRWVTDILVEQKYLSDHLIMETKNIHYQWTKILKLF